MFIENNLKNILGKYYKAPSKSKPTDDVIMEEIDESKIDETNGNERQ